MATPDLRTACMAACVWRMRMSRKKGMQTETMVMAKRQSLAEMSKVVMPKTDFLSCIHLISLGFLG